MKEKQIEEAIKRMQLLNLSTRCINEFKKGNVWESEGIGALYECDEKEKEYIKEFEEKNNCVVYHLIHNIFEFGECYTMLYVGNNEEEWEQDKQDIKDRYPFVYVKNVDYEDCCEYGSVLVRPNIGGLIRLE